MPACTFRKQCNNGVNNNISATVLLSMFAKQGVIADQTSDIKSGIDILPALLAGLTVVFIVSMVLFCRKGKAK